MLILDDSGSRDAGAFVASLELGARERVVADMVATVDGRASVDGRSVALGHPEDRALLRELRAAADAILVGTGTLAAEGYASLVDDEARERRVAEGRPPHPLVVTTSRRLALPVDEAPIFAEAGVPILAFGEVDADAGDAPPLVAGEAAPAEGAAAASFPGVRADLEVVRLPAPLSLAAVVAALRARGVKGILCEGGPSLLRRLVAEDLLDDLCLTVAPLLAAGGAPSILEGDVLPDAPRLALRGVHRADDHLFLHYGLRS